MLIGEFDAYTKEIITVNTVIGITDSLLQNSGQPPVRRAVLTIEVDQIRYWVDKDSTPTAAEGHLLNPDDVLEIEGINNIRNLKMIKVTNDATVMCTLFR